MLGEGGARLPGVRGGAYSIIARKKGGRGGAKYGYWEEGEGMEHMT